MYSAAQDSDFLVYPGMGEIMYDLKLDGTFHSVSLDRDVLGKKVGNYSFESWEHPHFIAFSAACGCDYIDNPKGVGLASLYKLVNSNLALSQDELLTLIASKAENATAYRVDLLAAVLSFQHHVVFALAADGSVSQQHLTPLPDGVAFTSYDVLTAEQCRGIWRGELHPTTLSARVVVTDYDDPNQPALEADFSSGRTPAQFSVQRLKAWLVNRGIAVPAQMARREQIVELVEQALTFPAGTWGVIKPWNAAMVGWTRPDPITLDARDPVTGEAAWRLMCEAPFPTVDDAFIHKLMPLSWANTLERGRKLFMDSMCYTAKLSIQHATSPDGTIVWVIRMPVRASMRGQQYLVRVSVSAHRPFLAPSS